MLYCPKLTTIALIYKVHLISIKLQLLHEFFY